MSSENLWKLKLLQGNLHQILGIWVGRNLITTRQIHGSMHVQECREESKIYTYQQIQLSNNKFINGIWGGGGVHLTWPDCNMYMYYGFFPKYDKNWYTDKPDNFHDTSIRREECTFSCSLVFYVVSWSHSMDDISTHQTGTIIIIIQFKLPQCKFSQKK